MASSSISSAAIVLLIAAVKLSLLTTPVSALDRLIAGESLKTGYSLYYGTYFFTMQPDCNLVLSEQYRPVWATGSNGMGSNCVAKMQKDGNFVIYDGKKAIWASNSNIRENEIYELILQKDRNVVIYAKNGRPIWETGTRVGNAAIAVIPLRNSTAAASGAAHHNGTEAHMARQRTRSRNGIIEG